MSKIVIMITMTSTEARLKFGEFLDKGTRQPVVITRQNREIGAFVPMEDLDKLRKLRMQELDERAKLLSAEGEANGFTEAILNEILAEVNPS